MRRVVIYTLLLFILTACLNGSSTETSYTISGQLEKEGETVYLYGWDSRYTKCDSTTSDKNGNFSISVPTDTIIPLALHMPDGRIVTLYAEPDLKATLSKDSLTGCGWSVNGGKTQALHDSISRILDSKSSYMARTAVIDSFIARHPNSEVCIMLLRRYMIEIPKPDNAHIRTRIANLSGNLQDHEYIVSTNKLINQNHSNILHKSFPGFEYKTIDGKKTTLTDFSQKYTLVTFWASWDEKSRTEMCKLRALSDSIKSETFNMLNISLDHDTGAWRSFVNSDSIAGVNVCDTAGFNSPILDKFNIKSIPFSMLVTPYQRISMYGVSFDSCVHHINSVVTKYDKEREESKKKNK